MLRRLLLRASQCQQRAPASAAGIAAATSSATAHSAAAARRRRHLLCGTPAAAFTGACVTFTAMHADCCSLLRVSAAVTVGADWPSLTYDAHALSARDALNLQPRFEHIQRTYECGCQGTCSSSSSSGSNNKNKSGSNKSSSSSCCARTGLRYHNGCSSLQAADALSGC